MGIVDVSQQGVSISSAQAEALEHGIEYLTKVHSFSCECSARSWVQDVAVEGPDLWRALLQSGAAVHQQQLPDLAQGVAAFYHLATGQVLDSRKNLGRMLSGLGFEQVAGFACALAMQFSSRCHKHAQEASGS